MYVNMSLWELYNFEQKRVLLIRLFKTLNINSRCKSKKLIMFKKTRHECIQNYGVYYTDNIPVELQS
jgi:hypothetical protein